MKLKFTTFDIKATVLELQQKLIGMRVVNVYDIDSKNYLIKLNRPDQKAVLLLESGIRLHTTEFEWPKNVMPSGFAMKMRKHLKGRRLEKLEQLGVDRIVDLQFGSGEAAYHVILELYDRGNIVLTDFEYMILNIQRPRTDNSQDVKFVVREKYPLDLAKKNEGLLSKERLTEILLTGKQGDVLKKILNPHLVYGGHLIEHCLLSVGMSANVKIGADFNISRDLDLLMEALKKAESIMNEVSTENIKGYIIQQKEKKPVVSPEESEYLLTYSEFHPLLYEQHVKEAYIEFDSFDKAIDEFFSKIESQKQDKKVFQQEKAALKKLDHIKSDHMKRIEGLKEEQETDVQRARLIELNLSLVDQAITVVRSALASQMDWPEIQRLLAEAAVAEGRDSVATSIKSLKLDTNHITMLLKYPFPVASEDSDDEMSSSSDVNLKPMKIDIDLGLSAHANARRFYDMKRHAAVKQMKTIDASEKAFKSAEKKTKQTLKEVHTVATINKARKTHWFEKFLWFISSENYVVIGGRDQQQNEFIVKRYLKPGDIYVHADLHGASSVVIKNPSREPVPPKTLNEAGSMALCNSAAWEAKVVTSSWWVYHDQVSKTAPSGEYLTTGSFMIRGKKNYLPPSYLIYGFGFLFKVDESCLSKHRNERRVRTIEDDEESLVNNLKEDPEEQVLVDSDDGNKSDDEDSSAVQTEEDNSSSRLEHQMIKEEEPGISLGNGISETEVKTPKEDEGATEFPDTTIQLQHIAGNQFQIQRNVSYSSVDSQPTNNEDSTDAISSETEKARGARLSAKQRRELKKKQQKMGVADVSEAVQSDVSEAVQTNVSEAVQSNVSEAVQSNVSEAVQSNVTEAVQLDVPATVQSNVPPEATDPTDDTSNRSSVQSVESNSKPQQPLKRGQKSKLKKIKDKYGDQDEEERQMRMELLASDRGPNEEKQKKSKKGGNSKQTSKAGQQKGGGGKDATKTTANQPKDVTKPATNQQKAQRGKLTINDIKDTSTITDESAPVQFDKPAVNTDAVADGDDGNEDEEIQEEDPNQLQQDMDLLDSLTGIPESDDILLYCVPVCAPYSTILNYKYKVKLVPGTTRRGKAAKMALNLFMHEKSTSMMEKDLFRSVKDTDLSRNMPGKVKVSSTAKQTKQKQR